MSIANIHFTNKMAEIYWDTLGYEPATGKYFRIPKAHVFPHIRTIFASQGSTFFNFNAAIQLSLVNSFDNSIDAVMPDLVHRLEAAEDATLEMMAKVQGDTNCRCYLAGWSNQLGRPVVMEAWASDANAERWKLRIYDSLKTSQRWHCLNVGYEHKNYSMAEYIAVAKRQRTAGLEEKGYQVVGGELIKTTITQHGIESKTVHVWHEDAQYLGNAAMELAA